MRYSFVGLALAAACSGREAARSGDSAVTLASSAPRVARAAFGTLPDGGAVEQFTLTNAHGVELRAISFGAIITSLRTPDRTGTPGDIVFGYDSLAAYVNDKSYFGAVVGRLGRAGQRLSRRGLARAHCRRGRDAAGTLV